MKVKFTYNKEIDSKCWKRYKTFIKKNGTVWGSSRSIKPIVEIKKADFDIDLTEIMTAYEKVFGFKVKIQGFVVTTPYSMINDDTKIIEKDGVVYYSIYTPNPSVVLAHEIFHIFFEKYTKRNIPNYDEAKEYFTVLINDIFNTNVSKGYSVHKKIRNKIYKLWIKNHSIDDCILLLKKIS
jgi:hypothetical protein